MRVSQPHRLEHGLEHLVMIARDPTLVHSRRPEALWQHLVKTTTTPLKREWMLWVAEDLKALGRIIHPDVEHNCDMAICTADDDILDRIVMAAVQSKRVTV